MGELESIFRWAGTLGGATTMAVGLFALKSRWFVHRDELDRMLEDRDRERDRAERAEQRLIDTIPVLTRAYEQISRVPHVAEKVVTTAAAVVTENGGGSKTRDSRK